MSDARLPELTEAERAALATVDIDAILWEGFGLTLEELSKRRAELAIRFFRERQEARRALVKLVATATARPTLHTNPNCACARCEDYRAAVAEAEKLVQP